MTKEQQEILDEAKRMYPLQTNFYTFTGIIVTSISNPMWDGSCIMVHAINPDGSAKMRIIYHDNEWAEIIPNEEKCDCQKYRDKAPGNEAWCDKCSKWGDTIPNNLSVLDKSFEEHEIDRLRSVISFYQEKLQQLTAQIEKRDEIIEELNKCIKSHQ